MDANDLRHYAAMLGRAGGRAGKGKTSPRKAASSAANGKKGGRPKKTPAAVPPLFVVVSCRRALPGNPGLLREWFKVINSKTRKLIAKFEDSRESEAFDLARKLNADPGSLPAR